MTFIIFLLILGLILVLLEIILLPGGIVGIFGGILIIYALVKAFITQGTVTGTIFLGISFISLALMLYFSFRYDVWGRFALKGTIKSRVNEGTLLGLEAGDEGKTVSALRPGGKAEFSGKIFEVQTFGDYADRGEKVRIAEIRNNKIFVETI